MGKPFIFNRELSKTTGLAFRLVVCVLLGAVFFVPFANANIINSYTLLGDTLPEILPSEHKDTIQWNDSIPETILNDKDILNDTIVKPVPLEQGDTQIDDTEEIVVAEFEEKPKHSPLKATMLSATLPGMGQAYNGKYFKIPIIYAGFAVAGYYLNMNSEGYNEWRSAYIARVDGNPNTVDDKPNVSSDNLRRIQNGYRRNLEITYIFGGIIYLLNILDATVDAHLIDFDVSEDLTFSIMPSLKPNVGFSSSSTGLAPGLSFKFRF